MSNSTSFHAVATGDPIEQTRGPQGDIGPQGDTGPQGPQGPQGNDGAQGPQGLQGPQGPVGPAGPAGADGADGADGSGGVEEAPINGIEYVRKNGLWKAVAEPPVADPVYAHRLYASTSTSSGTYTVSTATTCAQRAIVFKADSDTFVDGVQTILGYLASSPDLTGMGLKAHIYNMDMASTTTSVVVGSLVASSSLVSPTAEHFASNGVRQALNLPFTSPVPLTGGSYYIVVVSWENAELVFSNLPLVACVYTPGSLFMTPLNKVRLLGFRNLGVMSPGTATFDMTSDNANLPTNYCINPYRDFYAPATPVVIT